MTRTDTKPLTDRERALLTLAAAFDACGLSPVHLDPEAFGSRNDRSVWRGVIVAARRRAAE